MPTNEQDSPRNPPRESVWPSRGYGAWFNTQFFHSAQDYRPPAPDAVLAASSAQGLSMPHNLWYDYLVQVKVTDRLACR